MTDNEIIKALECCSVALMYDEKESLYGLALDLINRLQAKNKELREIAEYQQKLTMERGVEIKRLEERISMDKHDATELAYKNGQKQGITEFAEKLKQGLPTWLHPYIDLVEKEMAGEE